MADAVSGFHLRCPIEIVTGSEPPHHVIFARNHFPQWLAHMGNLPPVALHQDCEKPIFLPPAEMVRRTQAILERLSRDSQDRRDRPQPIPRLYVVQVIKRNAHDAEVTSYGPIVGGIGWTRIAIRLAPVWLRGLLPVLVAVGGFMIL
jgi:hypothetical protein